MLRTVSNNDTFEELPHGPVVDAVRAVEDDALLGHGLGQVLARLGLARAGRTLGSAAYKNTLLYLSTVSNVFSMIHTKIEFESDHECSVDPLRHRRHHQAVKVAQVLERIVQTGGHHFHLKEIYW